MKKAFCVLKLSNQSWLLFFKKILKYGRLPLTRNPSMTGINCPMKNINCLNIPEQSRVTLSEKEREQLEKEGDKRKDSFYWSVDFVPVGSSEYQLKQSIHLHQNRFSPTSSLFC